MSDTGLLDALRAFVAEWTKNDDAFINENYSVSQADARRNQGIGMRRLLAEVEGTLPAAFATVERAHISDLAETLLVPIDGRTWIELLEVVDKRSREWAESLIAKADGATVERALADMTRERDEALDRLRAERGIVATQAAVVKQAGDAWREARAQGEADRAALRGLTTDVARHFREEDVLGDVMISLARAEARLSATGASGDGAAAEGSEGT